MCCGRGSTQRSGRSSSSRSARSSRTSATPSTEISLEGGPRSVRRRAAEVDMEIEFPKSTEVLGRIAAQTAKQVIFAEGPRGRSGRTSTHEYQRSVSATWSPEHGQAVRERRHLRGIGSYRSAAAAPRTVARRELQRPATEIRAVIREVNKNVKGPQVILSRTDPALLIQAVPSRRCRRSTTASSFIKGAVREAGERAKVAVHSTERDIDPVGACVGMKGTRVQANHSRTARREDRHRRVVGGPAACSSPTPSARRGCSASRWSRGDEPA